MIRRNGEGALEVYPPRVVHPARLYATMQTQTAMLTPEKSAETWQTLMQLRCRQEILERWLSSEILPNGLRQSLQAMLCEVDDQLRILMTCSQR